MVRGVVLVPRSQPCVPYAWDEGIDVDRDALRGALQAMDSEVRIRA